MENACGPQTKAAIVVNMWGTTCNMNAIMKIAKSVNRLGTEAVYNIFAKTKKLQEQGKDIIDLSLGQSDFESPPHVVDATIKALKSGHHGYTLPNGIIECREAVSRKIKSLYKNL